jgi:hypothetical protein
MFPKYGDQGLFATTGRRRQNSVKRRIITDFGETGKFAEMRLDQNNNPLLRAPRHFEDIPERKYTITSIFKNCLFTSGNHAFFNILPTNSFAHDRLRLNGRMDKHGLRRPLRQRAADIMPLHEPA